MANISKKSEIHNIKQKKEYQVEKNAYITCGDVLRCPLITS
jgi:hypothetical protein